MLEPQSADSTAHSFSAIWIARLRALACIFARRLADLVARLHWFALPCDPIGDTGLFSHAFAD